MKLTLSVQCAIVDEALPTKKKFQHWIESVLLEEKSLTSAELSLCIVDEAEMVYLNETYRFKKGPTNVLSFPARLPPGINCDLLGDIIVCLPVLKKEAMEQHKTFEQHLAHLTVHGVLHLLGYDHETEEDAAVMEPLEINTLARLGFPNPYQYNTENV